MNSDSLVTHQGTRCIRNTSAYIQKSWLGSFMRVLMVFGALKTFQIRRILMTNGEDVISSNWKERGNILRAKLHCHFCSTSSFSLTAALIRKVRSRFMRLTKYV